jgi:hypothetical protein
VSFNLTEKLSSLKSGQMLIALWTAGAMSLFILSVVSCCPLKIRGWSSIVGLKATYACTTAMVGRETIADRLYSMPVGSLLYSMSFLALAALFYFPVRRLIRWLLR